MTHQFSENTTSEEVVELFADRVRGKNVLLIGATLKSMGAEFLRILAPYPRAIWVAGRDTTKVQAAVDAALAPINGTKPTIHLVQMDLTDFASVRAAAEKINAQGEPLDLLVHHAIIPWYREIHRNPDGYEAQFAGNHLGLFLFVSLLITRLRQAQHGARVVVLTSAAYAYAVLPRWDDPNYIKRPQEYNKNDPYRLSKLANVLFVREFAKRYSSEGLLAYVVNPGVVFTNGAQESAKEAMIAAGFMNEDGTPSATSPRKIKSLWQGVAGSFVAAFDHSLRDKSGAYLSDCQVVPDDQLAPTEAAKNLWARSEELLGISSS